MESPHLDETRPTDVHERGMPAMETAAAQEKIRLPAEADRGASEQDDVAAIEQHTGMEPSGSAERDAEPQAADAQPVGETQPALTGVDGLSPPPDITEGIERSPQGKRRWILWSVLGVLLLALIAGGSVYAGYNSAIDQRTRYQST